MEKYLTKCLDSVCNQSYKNLEILLVDDGSTDSSSKICLEYAKKDNRVKYFKKENGGLSSARNYGLDRCTGKYVGFVDSDDVIDKDMFKILYNNLIETKADLSICEVTRFTKEPKFVVTNNYEIYSKDDVLKIILQDKKICNYAVNKLYVKELMNDIKYPIGKYQEDVGTTYKFINNANKIVYTTSELYGYYCRNNSISRTLNKKFIYDYFEMIENRCKDLQNRNLDDYLDLNKANVIMGIFIDLSLNKNILKDKELSNYMHQRLKELKYLHKKVKNINTAKHNILIGILLFNKNLFFFIMKMYLKIKK